MQRSLFPLLYSVLLYVFMAFYPFYTDGRLECLWFGAIKDAAVTEDASKLLKRTLFFGLGTQLDCIPHLPCNCMWSGQK